MLTPRQVRAARAFLGWSQQTLADKAGVSLKAVQRFERGEVDPRDQTLERLAAALFKAGIDLLPAEGGLGEGLRGLRPPD